MTMKGTYGSSRIDLIMKTLLELMLKISMLSVVAHICNPSIQEAEAGGLQIQGQPEVHR
jgi:hypothetical protein